MKEKYNFKIDSSNKTVSIAISPLIFPTPVILHAAYHFIEDRKVIVGGDNDIITVTLIPNKKVEFTDLEELAYEFNIQLISSFVEDEESRKHAGVREAMLKAALAPVPPRSFSPQPPKENSCKQENQAKELK
jgi:His-Xaa-Ser system protein HxsD